MSSTMKALLVLDMQADFLPRGAVVVEHADALATGIATQITGGDWTAVAVSMNMFPKMHNSFVDQGGVWPEHCVRGTPGAKLDPSIAAAAMAFNETKSITTDADSALLVVHKGQKVDSPVASSAFGQPGNRTALGPYLMRNGITELYMCGIEQDAFAATIDDATAFGFNVHIIEDLCASRPGCGVIGQYKTMPRVRILKQADL